MIKTGSMLVAIPCRRSWRKWPGSNQMLTKSPRHTKGRLLWNPKSSLRSLCLTKEELEVCIPQIPLIERDLSHLAKCWVTTGWRDILLLCHFSTWNDVIAKVFLLIRVTMKVFVFHLQENGLPHKRCMRQQHKLPLKPRTPGSTCWSLSGSTFGYWLWTGGGNSMMPWTDWKR